MSWPTGGAAVELVVRDTGIGIAAGEIARLFERFHRVEGARARTHEGSGIGLALVQELVRCTAATVRVESAAGPGHRVHRDAPAGAATCPPTGSRAARGHGVDRPGAACRSSRRRWAGCPDAGRRTTGARRPASEPRRAGGRRGAGAARPRRRRQRRHARVRRPPAPRALGRRGGGRRRARRSPRSAARRPTSSSTDVMMPGLDGFELLARPARRPAPRADIPVILLSARAGEESRVEGLEAGADDYVIKPFSARELIARVEAHLKLKALRDARRARLSSASGPAEAEERTETVETINRIGQRLPPRRSSPRSCRRSPTSHEAGRRPVRRLLQRERRAR